MEGDNGFCSDYLNCTIPSAQNPSWKCTRYERDQHCCSETHYGNVDTWRRIAMLPPVMAQFDVHFEHGVYWIQFAQKSMLQLCHSPYIKTSLLTPVVSEDLTSFRKFSERKYQHTCSWHNLEVLFQSKISWTQNHKDNFKTKYKTLNASHRIKSWTENKYFQSANTRTSLANLWRDHKVIAVD